MAAAAGSSDQQNKRSCSHIPTFSARHPIIPRLYVMPWKQDIKNRKLLLKNAALAQIPVDPHEESLHFCGRERLCHSQTSSSSSSCSSTSSSLTPPPSGSAPLTHHSSRFSRYNSSAVTTRRLYQT